jgi:hypothetical protein
MGFEEELGRDLSEVDDLGLAAFLVHLVLFVGEVEVLVVGEVVVDVHVLLCLLSLLLVPEDQVDPVP